jgi:hypothetical protein
MSMVDTGIHRALALCVACVVALSVTHASAQPATVPTLPSEDGVRPWAKGVSDAEQEAARALYLEGNAEFVESRFARALAKYREAIRHWDHPAIRFNMAVCLINLDQLVEARDDLERSLAYGPAALGHDAYTQGTTYRKLLAAQLARITATCSEPGAVVMLDGRYLFTAPGNAEQDLLPGEHQLAATKPGFRTAFKTFIAAPGQRAAYDLKPQPELDPPYWPYWKHVLGAGAGVTAAGALTYLWAASGVRSYDDGVLLACMTGCSADEVRANTELNAKKDRALTRGAVAIAAMATGGAAVLTGVLGLILDKPRVRPESSRVAPVVTAVPGGAAVALGLSF